MNLAGFAFKIAFLKAMIPVMSKEDLRAYREICIRCLQQEATAEDIASINKLTQKFEKEVKECDPNAA